MEKSRIIPLKDYLKTLQLEYLSYCLRVSIYEKPEFIKMCEDICHKKKEKILSVAKRFNQSTIFENKMTFDLFFDQEFNQKQGPPNIQYTPMNSRCVSFWDKTYLFKKGVTVTYKGEECVILENFPSINKVKLKTPLLTVDGYISYWDVTISVDKTKLAMRQKQKEK